jgi:putative transposase
MKIADPGAYHIYNRGNFRQPIFYKEDNYLYFLDKCHKYLKPISEILTWCLMPNHFHFLIEVTEPSLIPKKVGSIQMPAITNGFRLLQSAYTKGLNQELNRTGNLFQQKTRSKYLEDNYDYLLNAFLYIHSNPVVAGLATKIHEWPFSSFNEFTGKNTVQLCNVARAKELLRVHNFDWEDALVKGVDAEMIKRIM